MLKKIVLEIEENGVRREVLQEEFRSYLGPRFLDGLSYHGPVYEPGTDRLRSGRECRCEACSYWERESGRR